MAKNKKTVEKEKVLKDFVDLLTTSAKEYEMYSKKVQELDKASQDLLHALELGSNRDARDNTTHLIEIRRQRRFAKEMAELLAPLADYSIEHKLALNKITQLIGALRTTQERFDRRQYTPRVIKKLSIGMQEVNK